MSLLTNKNKTKLMAPHVRELLSSYKLQTLLKRATKEYTKKLIDIILDVPFNKLMFPNEWYKKGSIRIKDSHCVIGVLNKSERKNEYIFSIAVSIFKNESEKDETDLYDFVTFTLTIDSVDLTNLLVVSNLPQKHKDSIQIVFEL